MPMNPLSKAMTDDKLKSTDVIRVKLSDLRPTPKGSNT